MKRTVRSTVILSSLCLTGFIAACSDSGGDDAGLSTGGASGSTGGNGSGTPDIANTEGAASSGHTGGSIGTATGGSGPGTATGGTSSVGAGGSSAALTGGSSSSTNTGGMISSGTGGRNGTSTGGTNSTANTGGVAPSTGGSVGNTTGGADPGTGGMTDNIGTGGINNTGTGGIETGSGGVGTGTGGNNSGTGGVNDDTGGNNSGTGGVNDDTGGNDSGTGDINDDTGGNDRGTGGINDNTGGNDSGTGGEVNTSCTITLDYETSSAIPTVGIVTWSATSSVSSARIEFGLEGSADVMEAPVDLTEPQYRTLLLGMKQQSDYVFRVVAETSNGTCVSDDHTLTTGTLSGAPTVSRSGSGGTKGFIVTSSGMGGGGMPGGGGFGGGSTAYIFDTDGDVVWMASAPSSASRAHMSWDGKDMWMEALNVGGSTNGGEMRRVSMDGLDVENNVAGLSGAHHDFTVTPDGIAVIVFNNSGCSAIVERSNSGSISNIVADVSTIYTPVGDCHTNYIRYYESDDSFTVSDRNPNLIVKIDRNGTLLWQFGGSSPKGSSFQVSESWQVNHGNDLGEDGRLVFFNNGNNGASKIMEFQLDESTMSSSKRWTYSPGTSSSVLGDVQRLPGGNYLVVFSTSGVVHEINSSQTVVQSFSASSLGYADYRPTLYGPPVHY